MLRVDIYQHGDLIASEITDYDAFIFANQDEIDELLMLEALRDFGSFEYRDATTTLRITNYTVPTYH